MASVSVSDWLTAAVEGAEELATTVLGLEGSSVKERRQELPRDAIASLVSLVGEDNSVEIGIAVQSDGGTMLARTMLCMDDDEELPDDDLNDALREAANIIAGVVKTKLSHQDGALKLGLPITIVGTVQDSKSYRSETASVDLGGTIAAEVFVLGKSK